ncbi:IS66 family insertion sequence element accessory protein TnpA [Changchengzhania lutea]|uniref:IS66 family insertion sequence element accessory protein TnpA n=1 Tax=Changchengzhania lutea TaxID=2049305 RepID=UPI00115ED88E|nr:hypothetical protein [Changchengzhania lutea]
MTKKDTASRMHKLVKQYQGSGQSQKEFAASHDIKEGKLYYWVSKLTKPRQVVSGSGSSEKNFVPIAFPALQEQQVRSIIIRCSSGVEIEISL